MDATNDQTSTNKPPLLPKPILSTSSNQPPEHVIPQMVITSADDEAEEIPKASEASPISNVSTFETTSTDIQVKDINLPAEPVKEQQVEDRNQAGEGNITSTSSKSVPEHSTEIKHEEPVSHSVIHRPLIIESERCVSQASIISEPSAQNSESPSPPPPSLPTTTMQRPLVFDQQADNFVLASEGTFEECSPNITPVIEENLEKDIAAENKQILSEVTEISVVDDTKPKSSSFSWMPSLPKLHASGKEEKTSDSHPSKKELESKEIQKSQDLDPNVKKDGLQNMKKFFDNLLHDTTTDTKEKPTIQIDHHEDLDVGSKKPHKDGKHGVMKLFSSSKHEPDTKGKISPTSMDLSKEGEGENKETCKESKFNVKKMFDSFKHDSSEKKDIAPNLSPSETKTKGRETPTPSEPPKETETASKDSKFNMKKMFDSFKHDSTEKKDVPSDSALDTKPKIMFSPTAAEGESKSKDASKDSKFSVKKMFDSFSHEKKDIQSDSSDMITKSVVTPPPTESKDTTKDSKFSMKKMFDSFKPDSPEKKDISPDSSDVKTKEVIIPAPTETESKSKDSKFHMKNMFDSFKPDSPERKDISSDTLQDTRTTEKRTSSPSKLPKEADGSSKDSKSTVKKMFDSFKHDSAEKKEIASALPPQSQESLDASTSHKDTKSGFKKFIDSFKHDEGTSNEITIVKVSETPIEPSKDGKVHISKSVPSGGDYAKQHLSREMRTSQTTQLPTPIDKPEIQIKVQADTNDLSDNANAKPKEGSVMKFFHSFKSDGSSTSKESTGKFHVRFFERDTLKRSHSFRDSILLKDEKISEQSEKVARDDSHNFKKYFVSAKHSDAQGSDKATEKKKLKPVKRSESCKETAAEKEGFHGIKGFFDSLTHKSTSKSSQVSTSPKKQAEEHIYDTVGKPDESFSGVTQSGGILKQTQSKSTDPKQRDDPSSVRKLFDSIRHKDPVSKPKSTEKEEKVYEKVDISPPVPSVNVSTRTLTDKKNQSITKDIRKEPQPPQNIETKKQKNARKEPHFSQDIDTNKQKDARKEPQPSQTIETKKQKDVPEIVLNISPELSKEKKTDSKITPSQVNGPSTSSDSKTSMFSSISGNFTALRDKMMHSKDSKKNDMLNHDKESEEYDLQNAVVKNQLPDSSAGTYKPLAEFSYVNDNVKHDTESKAKSSSAVVSDRNISSLPSKPSSQQPVTSDPKNLHRPGFKASAKIEPGTPETLYDTCCMRLANLLGKKALEIVSEKTKTPPKKPPKPSAEAIAKARAAVVSQRLRDLNTKGQSIGEAIPVGYDGIRFADDETESSCDYKDVENLDYIIDYELLNRYRCDSKLDRFNDPTCSSISSYYTADTVTLKDETFSDAALETISLDDDDSHLFQHLSSPKNQTDFHSLPSKIKSKDEREKLKSLTKAGENISSHTLTPTKKVPPPLPPKPTILSKQKSSQNRGTVSQCINGLSLSPRLQTKFQKDSAATQKRPLLVAGLKGTEFTSLQTKSKDHPSKERTFNTILKNESLKKVSTISPLHKPLQSTKSTPVLEQSHMVSESSASKKQSPQRPPPPVNVINPEDKKSQIKLGAPPVPEKPKREGRTASSPEVADKRTVSPPRPPPPVTTKVNVPPPRPPPPTPSVKSLINQQYENVENQAESSLPQTEEQVNTQMQLFHGKLTPEADSEQHEKLAAEVVCAHSIIDGHDQSQDRLSEGLVPETFAETRFENSITPDLIKTEEATIDVTPKPPPRGRRIRSRTVEIPPKEKMSEPSLRRSQSLTEIDIKTRTSHLNIDAPATKVDLKHLYTSVNKDGKKTVVSGSQSPNLVSSRPLPAPPPPPRKFRSLDRKPKDKQIQPEKVISKVNESRSNLPTSSSTDVLIKPPERKRKGDKHRFLSLSNERKRTSSEFQSSSLKMPRSYSVPLKPDRKVKHAHPEYDENANFAFPTVAEVHCSDVRLDECGNEIIEDSSSTNIPSVDAVDSAVGGGQPQTVNPHPRRKKEKNPKKSQSNWYDKADQSEESWEIVDWDSVAAKEREYSNIHSTRTRPPMRRRSDPIVGSKIRQTSKFYVDVEIGNEGLPLVDKETSPLHLDCSEKSVQTSLETLSQGVASRDEQSENQESSDNTDNLLNIVKTLQSELKTTLNRHKSLDDEDDTSNTATDSEKMESSQKKFLKTPSIQSSTSEVWPITSSEESDGEMSNDGAVNLSEMALTRKRNKIFYIAQEILTSEEVFVDTLKLLNVDFKAAVETASKLRNSPVVPDEVLSQILNHLPQLQQLNENLLMQLKDRIDNWDKTGKIADVIVKIGPFLKLYSWYIHDFESNLSLLEESKRKYPLFAQVVKEFEASSRCKRLALNHFMLKPIQRIPQYRLLLQEYLHHLSEDSPDYNDTVTALQIVSEVANHANDSMKQGDNAQKLISIQNSIMGHKEIIKPGRLFVKEGELMKLSRKGMQPRWFVLFNDLLLYLTPVQHGLYRINHELPLTGMKVAIPIQQDYQNEFSIISVTRSFTLAARSQEERQEWIVALTKAIEENASKRSTFTNIRLQKRMHDRNSEDDDGEFVLGKKAPVWIPDARVTMCQLCTSEFTVTFRRHHCRACGKVICSICSSNRIPLAYLGGSKVNRVCDDCYSKLGPEAAGSAENAETDSDNQQIAVKPHLRTEHRYIKKGKRNLPSVLKEVCANDQGSTISGYLQKRIGKSWKKEWFVVKDKVLYEYKASEDVAALSSAPLLGYQIESFSEMYENVDPSLLFRLTHPGQAPIVFHTDSISSTERWIAALKEASVLE